MTSTPYVPDGMADMVGPEHMAAIKANIYADRPCRCGGTASGQCIRCDVDLAGNPDHYDDGDALLCGPCYRSVRGTR